MGKKSKFKGQLKEMGNVKWATLQIGQLKMGKEE
jgi:hypothetical protein